MIRTIPLITGFLVMPGAFCGSAGVNNASLGQDNLALMKAAEKIVSATYPEALLIEADGSPTGDVATTADDIEHWRFVFAIPDKSASVLLFWDMGSFGKPQYIPQPFLGAELEPLPRKMNLARAVRLMRDAGHGAPFDGVSFYRPVAPGVKEALYIFGLPDKFVFVGAVSGDVHEQPRGKARWRRVAR